MNEKETASYRKIMDTILSLNLSSEDERQRVRIELEKANFGEDIIAQYRKQSQSESEDS